MAAKRGSDAHGAARSVSSGDSATVSPAATRSRQSAVRQRLLHAKRQRIGAVVRERVARREAVRPVEADRFPLVDASLEAQGAESLLARLRFEAVEDAPADLAAARAGLTNICFTSP